MTAGLIALCGFAFLVTLGVVVGHADSPVTTLLRALWTIDDDVRLRQLGALDLPAIWLFGQWWRLFSGALLHGSLLHLLFNGAALAAIGEWIEPVIGSWRTAAILLVAALGGSLASVAWCESAIVVGVSGAVFGLAAALWLALVLGPPEIAKNLEELSAWRLGGMILFGLALGPMIPALAQAGHLGGLVAGGLGGLVLIRGSWIRRVAGLLLLGLLVAGTILAAAPVSRTNHFLFLGARHLERQEAEEALAAFEIALARRPEDAAIANAVAYSLSLAGVELDRAEALVDRALDEDAGNADYLDTKGWIACRRGELEEGLRWLERAREAAPREIAEVEEHLRECAGAIVGATGGD